jgi:hypothetical protein
MTIEVQSLSGSAVDVLGQLFVAGPVWDGNLISKSGRDELVRVGLAHQWNGWQTLTQDGLTAAVEWKMAEETPQNRSWFRKQRAR